MFVCYRNEKNQKSYWRGGSYLWYDVLTHLGSINLAITSYKVQRSKSWLIFDEVNTLFSSPYFDNIILLMFIEVDLNCD